MKEMRLFVPTYYGEHPSKKEFDSPEVAVVIHSAAGVRVVLGTHEWMDYDFPDIAIERRANGWAIFLHPVGGGDPSGHVYFLDDGRSFLVPENGMGPTPTITIESDEVASAQLDVQLRPWLRMRHGAKR